LIAEPFERIDRKGFPYPQASPGLVDFDFCSTGEKNTVTSNAKMGVLGGVSAVIIVAGGFYIMNLRADLDQARQETLAAQQQVQKVTASLSQTEASLTSATQAQEQLKTQLAESNVKLEGVSADLGNEIEALKQQVAALQSEIASGNKVSGWWRDLFDYTKPFDGAESKGTAG